MVAINVTSEVITSFAGRKRAVRLKLDARYRVDPLNPAKKKHRGRTGVLVEWDDKQGEALIRFDDTGRCGKVDTGDLVAM